MTFSVVLSERRWKMVGMMRSGVSVTFQSSEWWWWWWEVWGRGQKGEKETKQMVCMWHISSSLVKFSPPSLHRPPPPTPPLPLPPPLQEAHEGAAASAGGTGTAGSGGWAGSHSGRIFGVSWHLGERFQLVRDPRVHFDGFAGE